MHLFHAQIEIRGTAKLFFVTIAKIHRNDKLTDMLSIVLMFDYPFSILEVLYCKENIFTFLDNQQGYNNSHDF